MVLKLGTEEPSLPRVAPQRPHGRRREAEQAELQPCPASAKTALLSKAAFETEVPGKFLF